MPLLTAFLLVPRTAKIEAVTRFLPRTLKPGLVGLLILVLLAFERLYANARQRLSKRFSVPKSPHGLAIGQMVC